ncbi:class II aldolase [Burkholderia sp. THE68]|uniref:aldolase n=1 Tax=Burkholderia sp. THE68 TaxID=758782 RepID=UPI0013166B33|nr:aldolase [Burkholderia sp. THE68]BBU30306.1 class II aldolase [Burkholderia sp. THE68]
MSTVQIRSKDEYLKKTAANVERHLAIPEWTIKQKLALSARMLAAADHDSGLAGQLTARAAQPGSYWMLRFGLGLEEVTPDNLLLVDDDLNVLEGEGMPNPSNRFHLWIYRHRPDVNSVIHTHPPHVSALSMIGVPLEAAHMDTSMFHDDCAWLPEWPGVPVGDDEGRIINEALGDKRSILLANHGQLCACGTVEEATIMALFFEKAARLQLMAMSCGKIQAIDPARAKEAHDYRLKPRTIGATFAYYSRRILKDEPTLLDSAGT